MEDIRKGTCPLCKHNEIVETAPKDQMGREGALPLSAHSGVDKSRWLPRFVQRGELHTYICRRCGYVQWFASDPDSIPIGAEHDTRVIKGPEPAGPYR